jgi:adenylate cyclase
MENADSDVGISVCRTEIMMSVEIERKFLVCNNKWKDEVIIKTVEICQGYLVKNRNTTVRIRIADTTAYLTVKGKKVDISVPEFEYEIPLDDALQLIEMSVTPCISKTRHYIRDNKNQVWEVDLFKGINRGLVMAEIELQSDKQQVILPSWVGSEVSHDKRYTNTYLAEHKVPQQL